MERDNPKRTMPESLSHLLRIFTDPRMLVLIAVFLLIVAVVAVLGQILLPVFIALLFAYALEGGVQRLLRLGLRRGVAITGVYLSFLLLYCAILLGPLQLAVRQAANLSRELNRLEVMQLDQLYAEWIQLLENFVGVEISTDLLPALVERLQLSPDLILQQAFSAVGGATTWLIYLSLIPLLVGFLLVDKESLLQATRRLLPKNLQLVQQIWHEMELRMANYVRGKLWEILVVGAVAWVIFASFGSNYAAVLSVVTGFSVLIPYVGAFTVGVLVFLLGYAQWDFSAILLWFMIAYAILQFLDGNILAPLLFSEAVALTPTTILIGIIIFGGLWGIWGVFFAIPLATLAKALASTWIEFRDSLAA